MNSIVRNSQNVNCQGKSSPDILTVVDLIDHMRGHHQEQALELVELARWHQQQAEALAAERRALAADMTAVLAEAEGLLR